jgi:putative flippase GtrA
MTTGILGPVPTPRPPTAPQLDIASTAADRHPVLDLVIPVFNEENDLEASVRRLHSYLSTKFPYSFQLTIADNASTDSTPRIASLLEQELSEVKFLRLEEKGRGRALRTAWSRSSAAVLSYVDVDLSTDLDALLPLVAPLVSGHSDLAIGTRLSRGSRVIRGLKREVISRCYNLILRGALAARFSDAQCGFKAIRREVAVQLLPLVEDTGWFFDTELLVLAERAGLRIHEVPVDWIDDPDSRVDIVSTALADLRGIARLGRGLATGAVPLAGLTAQFGRERPLLRAPATGAVREIPAGLIRQLTRFAAIGILSTAVYLMLFLALRTSIGGFAANLLALTITAFANTAANRRLTFGVRGRQGLGRHHAEGLAVFGLGLALTTGALGILTWLTPHSGRLSELTVLTIANLAATLLRFLLFRAWVFRPRRDSPRNSHRYSPDGSPSDFQISGQKSAGNSSDGSTEKETTS